MNRKDAKNAKFLLLCAFCVFAVQLSGVVKEDESFPHLQDTHILIAIRIRLRPA
jgi:hypothetical protein